MTHLTSVASRIAHVAALVFCAWWLVATSAIEEPPRECFTGVSDEPTIQVLLGPAERVADAYLSCDGLDGLVPGNTLVLELLKEMPDHGCVGYQARASVNVAGLTIVTGPVSTSDGDFTSLHGSFARPETPACVGSWDLTLKPEQLPPAGQLISPLDAGPTQRWIVERRIRSGRAEQCGLRKPPHVFTGALCGDRFVVEAIAEIPR